ncbi:DUF2384 domain-containing protein [Thiotrichales bacterium 19S9-12]|nr:DUF2384 domain-containing protein [Thiotrichales bacterium 19S9-11]MCF6811249.1 DUF2384 domain-containing protein [Thiotrichales bacterium 19S9-12]
MTVLIDSLLGKTSFKNKQIHSDSDLYDEINHGIKSAALTRFAKVSGLTEERLLALIPITRKTFLRRKEQGFLGSNESDRLILIAKVYAHALDVFGQKEKTHQWLITNNISLDNKKPIDLLKNSLGCQIVDDILYRIEYGIYS